MEFKDVVQALRTGWWLLVAAVLIGVAGGGFLTWTATPLYSSTTKLFVSTTATTDTSSAYQGNLFSQQRVASYAQLLASARLASEVVEELDLDMTAKELAGKISATSVPQTVILSVTVTDSSPQRAADIASVLGSRFAANVTELETPVDGTTSAVKVSTMQAAEVNETPVSPNLERNLLLGIAAGLVLGLTLAVMRSRLDNTVKSAEDIRELTGTGVIGTVLEDPRVASDHLVTELDQHSLAAEAYRSIRTNLQFINVDSPPRVIVVTSAIPGEGKTTLAVNVASVLAQSGSRVMLIEADLRRPRVTKYMGLISGAGLSNVLGGTAMLREVEQRHGDGRLTVLAAGPMPPNPSEMLGSRNMRLLVEDLRRRYDYVIIDAPPLLAVTDAAVLTAVADGSVISTRYGKTRREELEEAANALERIEAPLLGVILNRVPQAAGAARGYGYAYGYEADPGRQTTGVVRPLASARSERGRRAQSADTGPLEAVPTRR